jgi:DNA-directed RNA polymerase specialized sigma24 family protein
VILLRFIDGLPIRDTALSLHRSEDAIKGLQRRALISLRNMLQTGDNSYEPTG